MGEVKQAGAPGPAPPPRPALVLSALLLEVVLASLACAAVFHPDRWGLQGDPREEVNSATATVWKVFSVLEVVLMACGAVTFVAQLLDGGEVDQEPAQEVGADPESAEAGRMQVAGSPGSPRKEQGEVGADPESGEAGRMQVAGSPGSPRKKQEFGAWLWIMIMQLPAVKPVTLSFWAATRVDRVSAAARTLMVARIAYPLLLILFLAPVYPFAALPFVNIVTSVLGAAAGLAAHFRVFRHVPRFRKPYLAFAVLAAVAKPGMSGQLAGASGLVADLSARDGRQVLWVLSAMYGVLFDVPPLVMGIMQLRESSGEGYEGPGTGPAVLALVMNLVTLVVACVMLALGPHLGWGPSTPDYKEGQKEKAGGGGGGGGAEGFALGAGIGALAGAIF